MKRKLLCQALMAAGLMAAPFSHAALLITEIMSSANSSADWFELTNTGSSAVTVTGYKMDDNSFNTANAVSLSGVTTIAAGESVIFVEGTSSTATTLRTLWGLPSSVQIGSYTGSGVGLSASGDGVIVYDSSNSQQSKQQFGSATTGLSFVFSSDNTASGSASKSSANYANCAMKSVNSSGSRDSGTPGRNGTTALTAPTLSAASSISTSGFTLNWSAVSAPVQSYYVEVFSDSGYTTLVSNYLTDSSTTSQTVTGLTGNTTYYYRVNTLDATGCSSFSTSSQATLDNDRPTLSGLTTGSAYPMTTGDATEPLLTTGLSFTVADTETAAASLVVTASSSNTSVVANSGLALTHNGSGSWTLKITPAGVGYADVTVTVTDTGKPAGTPANVSSATVTLKLAVSSGATADSNTRWIGGRSDGSAAVVLDSTYVMVADDEPSNVIHVYDRSKSGPAVATLTNLASLVNTSTSSNCLGLGSDSRCDSESDLEGATRIGSRTYWLGSHSNNKDGKLRPDRWRLFALDVAGTGASTALSNPGYYSHLRTDLLNWDAGNSHGLGGNHLGLTASAAAGRAPEVSTLDGFSFEGLTSSPDDSKAWLAMRAPLVAAPGAAAVTADSSSGRTHALIIQLNNYSTLTANGTTGGSAGSASFGTPIRLDLGGRAIRDIKKNSAGQYLIVAGPPDSATGNAPKNFRLYSWDGSVSATGLATNVNLHATSFAGFTNPNFAASVEGIVEVPDSLSASTLIEVVSDLGDALLYGDSTVAKDLSTSAFKKSRIDKVALGEKRSTPFAAPVLATQPASGNQNSITLSGTAEVGSTLTILRGNTVLTSSLSVGAGASFSYEVTGLGEGLHTFTLRAGDSIGNTSPDATFSYTVNPAAPTSGVINPIPGASVTLSGQGEVTLSNGVTLTITGTGAAGSTLKLPMSTGDTMSAVLSLPGGLTITAKPLDSSTSLGLVKVGNQVLPQLQTGSLSFTATQGSGPILVVGGAVGGGSPSVVEISGLNSEVTATLNGSALTLTVGKGTLVITLGAPVAGASKDGRPSEDGKFAASGTVTVLEGERVVLDAQGQVSRIELGSNDFNRAGDPVFFLRTTLPKGMTLDPLSPRINAPVTRLQGQRLDTVLNSSVSQLLGLSPGTEPQWDLELGGLRFNVPPVQILSRPAGSVLIDPTAATGTKIRSDGTVEAVRNGVVTTLVPGLSDIAGLMRQLQALDTTATARLDASGRLHVQLRGQSHVLLPDFILSPTRSAPGLTLSDSGGTWTWIDSTHQQQRLYPAFSRFYRVKAALLTFDPKASVQQNLDGTVTASFANSTLLLRADSRLSPTPARFARSDYYQDSGVFYLNLLDGFSQAFSTR